MSSYFPLLKIESVLRRINRSFTSCVYQSQLFSAFVLEVRDTQPGGSTWPSCGTVYVAHNSESNGLILHAGGRKEETRAMLMQSGRLDTYGVYTVYRCANTQLHARIDACGSGAHVPPPPMHSPRKASGLERCK